LESVEEYCVSDSFVFNFVFHLTREKQNEVYPHKEWKASWKPHPHDFVLTSQLY